MLTKLLNNNRIKKVKSVNTYFDAINLACEPLLLDNSISNKYIENIFKTIDKYGPYFILSDNFAIPHSYDFNGVIEDSMSLLVVEDGVDFLGKNVNVFLVIASKDVKSHLENLQLMASYFYEKDIIKNLIISDENKFIDILSNFETTL